MKAFKSIHKHGHNREGQLTVTQFTWRKRRSAL